MGEFPACPSEAVSAAEAACGRIVLTEITDRRGCAVWKAAGTVATVAIKAGYGEGEEPTAREAAVLDQLPGYSVTSGRHDGGVWYITPWLAGPSTWNVFAGAREGRPADRPVALAASVDLCRAVAGLHVAGWVHSDLQPAHGIHTGAGARLIDFSWSWHPDFEQSAFFKGGIVHLLAPELAASIQAGIRPVKPTMAAEVYTLAGTLWTCTTGRWPLDYAAIGIDHRAAGPDGIRDAIALGTVPLSTKPDWSAVGYVLRDVLLAKAADRPTAIELAATLEGL